MQYVTNREIEAIICIAIAFKHGVCIFTIAPHIITVVYSVSLDIFGYSIDPSKMADVKDSKSIRILSLTKHDRFVNTKRPVVDANPLTNKRIL